MGRERTTGVIGTSEARAKLPSLVREVIAHETPVGSFREHAVEIRTRGEQRSALLIASADAEAVEARIDGLEEDLENAGIALFLQERLGGGDAKRVDAATFLSGIGMEEFIDELPERG